MASYKIKSGDTLSDIAQSNNTTVADIQAANPSIKNPDLIYAGQTITIPDVGNSSAPAQKTTAQKTTAPTTTTQADSIPDYSKYSYDASTDAAYQQALAALKSASEKVPTYSATYDAQLNDIYNQIVNREKFSYDLNSDALYNQYKDQYTNLGKMAMMDTMGQAAAMTGGYGNSYASTAGNQAYQSYLQQLNDVVPELYGMALDQYNQEGDNLYNQFAMTGDLADIEYGRYQDALSNYWKEVSHLTDRADTAYDKGYENWYNSYQMGVDADNLAYEKAKSEEETAYDRQNDAYDRLVSLITTTGYTPSAEELTAAGMSDSQAKAYADYYKKQTAAAVSNNPGPNNPKPDDDDPKPVDDDPKPLEAKPIDYTEYYNKMKAKGYNDIEADLNTLIATGASKSEINSMLRAELNEGNITQAQYTTLKAKYVPRNYTY